jgi:hypothetical protein
MKEAGEFWGAYHFVVGVLAALRAEGLTCLGNVNLQSN